MKIILGAIKEFNDDALLMARQLGSEGFHFNTPPIATSDEDFWTVRALRWLKEYTEKFDLKLEMIENVPIRFFESIMLGSSDRDEKIENYIKKDIYFLSKYISFIFFYLLFYFLINFL